MNFFFVNKNINLNCIAGGNYPKDLIAPPEETIQSRMVSSKNIYVSTESHIEQLCGLAKLTNNAGCIECSPESSKNQIMNHASFPLNLGYNKMVNTQLIALQTKIAPLRIKKELKIAVINGIGSGTGDAIVGLKALEYFHKILSESFSQISVDLFQINSLKNKAIYEKNPNIHEIIQLPVPLPNLLNYDAYVDLSGFIAREEFNNQAFIDFYLEAFSIPKDYYLPQEKRTINLNNLLDKSLQNHLDHTLPLDRKLILFHPIASTPIRSLPPEKSKRIILEILNSTNFCIISTSKIEIQHERFIDLSKLSNTLGNFINIIHKMDGIISVDTCTYHIADSFNIPAVALFNTINPEFRTKYYPYTAAIWPKGQENLISGQHHNNNQDAVNYSQKLWEDVSSADILQELRRMLKIAPKKQKKDISPTQQKEYLEQTLKNIENLKVEIGKTLQDNDQKTSGNVSTLDTSQAITETNSFIAQVNELLNEKKREEFGENISSNSQTTEILNKSSKFLIISAYTENIKDYGEICEKSIINYVKENNYACKIYHDGFDKTRHPVWSKIKFVSNNINEYEYLLWIDADAIIANLEFKLESILEKDKELYICNDRMGINTGVFMIKSSSFSRDLMETIFEQRHFNGIAWQEQSALTYLYTTNYNNLQDKTKFIKQSLFNSYIHRLYNFQYPEGEYTEGSSFVLHLPALPKDLRVSILNNTLQSLLDKPKYPTLDTGNDCAFVNIIVGAWNRLDFTKSCINSIRTYSDFPYKLTVIDNGSTDQTATYLRKLKHDGIINNLIIIRENIGSQQSANLGLLQEPEANWHLWLANDMSFQKPFLKNLVTIAKNLSNSGTIGYNYEVRFNKLCDYPTQHIIEGIPIHIKNGIIPGGCMFVPKTTIDNIGYINEEYSPYGMDDVDYGLRSTLCGLKNIYITLPDVVRELKYLGDDGLHILSPTNPTDGVSADLDRMGYDHSIKEQSNNIQELCKSNFAKYRNGEKALFCDTKMKDPDYVALLVSEYASTCNIE